MSEFTDREKLIYASYYVAWTSHNRVSINGELYPVVDETIAEHLHKTMIKNAVEIYDSIEDFKKYLDELLEVNSRLCERSLIAMIDQQLDKIVNKKDE